LGIVLANLLRRHGGETFPAPSRRKLDADPLLHRLAAVHGDAVSGPIGQVIPLVQHCHVLPRHLRFLSGQSREDRRERLADIDWHVARLAARGLLRVGGTQGNDYGGSRGSGQQFLAVRQAHMLLP
jgi:hypothetical protein